MQRAFRTSISNPEGIDVRSEAPKRQLEEVKTGENKMSKTELLGDFMNEQLSITGWIDAYNMGAKTADYVLEKLHNREIKYSGLMRKYQQRFPEFVPSEKNTKAIAELDILIDSCNSNFHRIIENDDLTSDEKLQAVKDTVCSKFGLIKKIVMGD